MPPNKPREKDRERDIDSSKSKDRPRHKSSRSSRKIEKAATPPERSSASPTRTKPRRSSMPVPESERTASTSPLGSKNSLPYPSFSKAHSKEAVGSREQVVKPADSPKPRMHYFTPDATDIDKEKDEEVEHKRRGGKSAAPPTPPETTMTEKDKMEKIQEDSVKTEKSTADTVKADKAKTGHIKTGKTKADPVRVERKRTDLQKAADELKSKLSRESAKTSEIRKERHPHPSRSRRDDVKESGKDDARTTPSPKTSKPGTPSKLWPKVAAVEDAASDTSFRKASSSVQSTGNKSDARTVSTDSDATSIAPDQPSTQRPFTPLVNRLSSPDTEPDSPEPRTPLASEFPPSRKETPAYSINGENTPSMVGESPMPPPPPPPPPSEMPAPKVDYLLMNGGLPKEVPRSLVAAGQPLHMSQSAPPMSVQVDRFFSPFNTVLDDYTKVINRSGSLAVATGYRSVARRLLDRIERVFARDLSAETCLCELCQRTSETDQELDDKRGVSWGEILEYVCGRQDLPPWPPFAIDNFGLGTSASEQVAPMQELDVDVPEEFRDHYVRQSKKTKQSVDRWLESQPTDPIGPPQDVDDETLTFAMLTRLEPDQRPFFSSILGVTPCPSRPASVAPPPPRPASTTSLRSTTFMPPASSLLQKTSLALERLYRLPAPPRDPESAMYLITNPPLHNVLATLAAVSDHEWDLLISGRFDGFLRSGADEQSTPTPSLPASALPSRGPSRTQPHSTPTFPTMVTPSLPPSRHPTPFNPTSSSSPSAATAGAPVALDEETEIAVLAEIERDIYLGMEALEDAFESLHVKAETVRRTLRERGAGLAQANQKRNAWLGFPGGEARLGTPASGIGIVAWDSETDDGIEDAASELAPDDSASNISRSRVRRPRRRNERRTPAPVEEEDESEEVDERVPVGAARVGRSEAAGGGVAGMGSKIGKWFGGV